MSIGDGLCFLGGCVVLASCVVAVAWTSIADRRERHRAAK